MAAYRRIGIAQCTAEARQWAGIPKLAQRLGRVHPNERPGRNQGAAERGQGVGTEPQQVGRRRLDFPPVATKQPFFRVRKEIEPVRRWRIRFRAAGELVREPCGSLPTFSSGATRPAAQPPIWLMLRPGF